MVHLASKYKLNTCMLATIPYEIEKRCNTPNIRSVSKLTKKESINYFEETIKDDNLLIPAPIELTIKPSTKSLKARIKILDKILPRL